MCNLDPVLGEISWFEGNAIILVWILVSAEPRLTMFRSLLDSYYTYKTRQKSQINSKVCTLYAYTHVPKHLIMYHGDLLVFIALKLTEFPESLA